MSSFKDDLKVIMDELKQQREELVVQAHLAKAEAKQELEQLDKKWQNFSFRAQKVLDELKETSGDVQTDLKIIGADLKERYSRIKKIVK